MNLAKQINGLNAVTNHWHCGRRGDEDEHTKSTQSARKTYKTADKHNKIDGLLKTKSCSDKIKYLTIKMII